MKLIALVLLILVIAPRAPSLRASGEALTYHTQSLDVNGRSFAVRLPQGLGLTLLTPALDGPRLLTFADHGELFIGSRSGSIYRLSPPYDRPEELVQLDGYPHSVAFRPGEILIARTDGLYRAPYRPGQPTLDPDQVSLLAALPGGGGHNSRTLSVGPDGRVYLGLGISGNCSDQYLGAEYPFEDRRGGVLVLEEPASGAARWRPYGSGLRNPVGLAWQPASNVLYVSNNGPDHHGYEQPPEYFSRVAPGSFHGMPWFQYDGQRLRRDDCVRSVPPRPREEVSLPVATFPARSAPMGAAFVPEGALLPRLQGDAIVALHGSWGTRPSGGALGDPATRRPPQLVAVRFVDGRVLRVDELVSGFQLENGNRWARPVGLAIGPDGALYFTSDGGINGLFRLAPQP